MTTTPPMSQFWTCIFDLVLASGSDIRRQLLEAAGLPFTVVPPNVDERAIEVSAPDVAPCDLALALARAKALAISAEFPQALVIGADQVLSLERRIFHKSSTRQEALKVLLDLSGRTHRLTSAFALARGGRVLEADVEIADMTMRVLDEDALCIYLDAVGESVLRSVGAYQWEGLGVHLFTRATGNHSTVLGMPMLKLLAALRTLGALRI